MRKTSFFTTRFCDTMKLQIPHQNFLILGQSINSEKYHDSRDFYVNKRCDFTKFRILISQNFGTWLILRHIVMFIKLQLCKIHIIATQSCNFMSKILIWKISFYCILRQKVVMSWILHKTQFLDKKLQWYKTHGKVVILC